MIVNFVCHTNKCSTSQNYLYMLTMADNQVLYVFPVLWMTS